MKALVPFPCTSPVRVAAPVPPPATPSLPASVLVKVRVSPEPVIVVDAVRPLKGVEEVARVTVGPSAVCARGPMAVTAVESLLLKVVQSAEARHPKTEPDAISQVTAPAAYVRPVEKVVVATPVHPAPV